MRHLWLVLVGAWVGCSTDAAVNPQAGTNACVTATACGLVAGGVSGCSALVAGVNVDYFANISRITTAQVNCISNAGSDCNAARRCLNGGAAPSPCTGTSNSCTGNNLVSCSTKTGTNGGMATSQFDCSAIGMLCVATADEIDCGAGTCAGLSFGCQGSSLQYCDGKGLLRLSDCAEFGGTCVTSGVAHCRGTGASCSQTSADPFNPPPIRCDGNTLVFCTDSQEARFDCGKVGLGCYAGANGKPFACALGNQCQPSSFSSTCANNTLSFCNNGVNATYNCAASGFNSCDPSNGGRCKS